MEGAPKRKWGVTNPISEAPPSEADLKLNDELIAYLKDKNNFETPEGMENRQKVLQLVQKVAEEFMRRVGRAKKLSEATVNSLGGKVFTFGSYQLGAYGPTSDIDTLILAPKHVMLDDFFEHWPSTFRELSNPDELTEMVVVPEAYVPIIKMEYRGVSLDVIFASLPTQATIGRDFKLDDMNVLKGLNPDQMRSVNGVRCGEELQQSVPQIKTFRHALRTIKMWANRRGVYGAVFGYPGGIAWAIMVARICQLYPYACGATVVSKFFNLMRKWRWPRPIMLKESGGGGPLNLPYWNPSHDHKARAHMMPVITPAVPQMCSTHSVSLSTMALMMDEFERADNIINSIVTGGKRWDDLFQRHTFFTKNHKYYLAVHATCTTKNAHDQFSGLVKSKVRLLAKGIDEGETNIKYAITYMDGFDRYHRCGNEDQISQVRQGQLKYKIDKDQIPKDDAQPSSDGWPKTIYTTTFYIGLILPEEDMKSDGKAKLDISWPVSDFRSLVENHPDYDANTMGVRVVHIRDHQLPDDVFEEGETRPTKPIKEKKKKANGTRIKHSNANGTTTASTKAKRQFEETGLEVRTSKRQK
ncbi:Poly(A) polymerase [Lentithecium fluviatile CBS 122367]|uniref:Poly(A) polymerase n=1 Tax=Lentithecium fluviatile CBS 122367 TaxID=1168545 RepID=A0A6G1J073_9PLEO|nr:Poly(A) polymerase [Lentithecium fluviatile CBS 122367]